MIFKHMIKDKRTVDNRHSQIILEYFLFKTVYFCRMKETLIMKHVGRINLQYWRMRKYSMLTGKYL